MHSPASSNEDSDSESSSRRAFWRAEWVEAQIEAFKAQELAEEELLLQELRWEEQQSQAGPPEQQGQQVEAKESATVTEWHLFAF